MNTIKLRLESEAKESKSLYRRIEHTLMNNGFTSETNDAHEWWEKDGVTYTLSNIEDNDFIMREVLELTQKEAIELCIKQWETVKKLATEYMAQGINHKGLTTLKSEALELMGYEFKDVLHQCFCCQYAKTQFSKPTFGETYCEKCPLIWTDENGDEIIDYAYACENSVEYSPLMNDTSCLNVIECANKIIKIANDALSKVK